MPLVRGAAPKTPKARIASQIETHFFIGGERHEKTKPACERVAERRGAGSSAQAGGGCGAGHGPFLRSLILGVELRPRPPDTYAALLRELSAIGNNINQIAHTVNAQKYAADSQVDRAVALVQRAWRLVKDSF